MFRQMNDGHHFSPLTMKNTDIHIRDSHLGIKIGKIVV